MRQMLLRLMSFFPRKLPVGMNAFNEFTNRILAQTGKYADEDSMRYVMASAILHLDSKKGAVPDSHFVNVLRKAAANQVASEVFQQIKLKQEQKQAQSVEVTTDTQSESASNVQKV